MQSPPSRSSRSIDTPNRDARGNAIAAVALGLMVVWPTSASGEYPQPKTLSHWVRALYRLDIEPMPSVSCGASNCHGGPQPGLSRPALAGNSAYGLWLENDPHARSWKTLCSPNSVAILTRLGILDGQRITDAAAFDNCLACHNTYRAPPMSTQGNPTQGRSLNESGPGGVMPRHTEGVGCAACHGPAERWASEHFLASWRPHHAADIGFVPNANVVARARMCASCHVGDHDRDMNHDLIAAGHPALRFEMASHHSRLPKHWRDDAASDRASFEASLWAAGAVASADAWLALQQGRASKLTAVSTWPDFAAYDCSSCHQSLRLNSSRQPLSDSDRRGAAKAARWDLAPLTLWEHARSPEVVANHAPSATSPAETLEALRVSMERMSTSDPDNIVRLAAEIRSMLPGWTDARFSNGMGSASRLDSPPTVRPLQLVDLISHARVDGDATMTWEAAAQFYLLLAASQHEWPATAKLDLRTEVARLRLGLALPDGLDSPRYLLANPLGSAFNREQTRDALRCIIESMRDATPLPPTLELLPPPAKNPPSGAPVTESQERSSITLTGNTHVNPR